jgi:hypothetical protein
MSGKDFVDRLGELVRIAADGVSVERSMALARMMSVHYRPWHHRTGRAPEDHGMSLRDLERRLDRLGGTGHIGFGEALEVALQRSRERAQAWRAAGNSGSPPPEPFPSLSDGATRAEREAWRKLAEGRARVLHMGNEQSSPFPSLLAIYDMPDAELLQVLNGAGAAGVHRTHPERRLQHPTVGEDK